MYDVRILTRAFLVKHNNGNPRGITINQRFRELNRTFTEKFCEYFFRKSVQCSNDEEFLSANSTHNLTLAEDYTNELDDHIMTLSFISV